MAMWQPPELVARAKELTCDAFVHLYGSPFFFVVLLDAPTSELAVGLKERDLAHAQADGLAFRTELFTREGRSSSTMVGPRPTALGRPSFVNATRLDEVMSQSCYVVPLRKRSAVSFVSFVSVGRTRNHDIVLRHPSISKFHASLEIEDDELFVKDAGSRNHTYVNNESITERTAVHSGDSLRFGYVDGVVCKSAALWNAVRSRAR
jgi:hypothetical protein